MTLYSEGGQALLFPTTKIAEDRATSILLACLDRVYVLRRDLLASIGVKLPRRGCTFETKLHPRFGRDNGKLDIPDGMLILHKKKKEWRALIEVKIEQNLLDQGQLERYLKYVAENKCDTLITISNEMCVRPDIPPLRLKTTSKVLSKLSHFHWSWRYIKNTCQQILQGDEALDTTERYLLEQFVVFLNDKSSGVQGFTKMNRFWDNFVVKLRDDLPPSQEEYEAVLSDWFQESAELALIINQTLQCPVKEIVDTAFKDSAEQRAYDGIKHLKATGDLQSSYKIEGVKFPLNVTIDIDRRCYKIAMRYLPTDDVRTPYKQIEHFVRRFNNESAHSDLTLHAKWSRRTDMTGVTLFDAVSELKKAGNLMESNLVDLEKTSLKFIELRYTKAPKTKVFKHPAHIITSIEKDIQTFCSQYISL